MIERDYRKPLNLEIEEVPQKELPLTYRKFGGVKTQATHDRLNSLWYRVKEFMKDGQWRTLQKISRETGGSEASCSARLRDMRKQGFGSHTVNKRELEPGLFIYQLVLNPKDAEREAQKYFHAKHPKPFNITLDLKERQA